MLFLLSTISDFTLSICSKYSCIVLKFVAELSSSFNISIRPFEDCCTVFVAKHPETKPKRNIIETMESRIEWLDSMIDEAILNIESIEL